MGGHVSDSTESNLAPSPDHRERVSSRLVIVAPPELVGEIALAPSETRLGLGRRAEREDAPYVAHATVSRHHVTLRRSPSGGWSVEDCGSKNGTWVDGRALRGSSTALADGSVLRMGDVLMVYEAAVEAEDPVAATQISREVLFGDASAMRLLRTFVWRAARTGIPVLISGETGTGKERVAREIHRVSGRTGPFAAINCAELGRELFASTLFGYERGAFTGAENAQPGVLRTAQSGSVLLDEIGELDLELQAKLLRLIEEREVMPVGGTESQPIDVRILAATNRELARDVAAGRFRRDLYARLALSEVHVPPLSARRGDIVAWLEKFDRARVEAAGAEPLVFDPGAIELLLCRPWPNNLRELQRLVHQLAIEPARGSRVMREDIERVIGPGAAETSEDAEPKKPPIPTRAELEALLQRYDGSVRAIAKHLARDRRQIYRWLTAHDLVRPSHRREN